MGITGLDFFYFFLHKIALNMSAVSSIKLGSILIFASCVMHRMHRLFRFLQMYNALTTDDSYGWCQDKHQELNVSSSNNNGSYSTTLNMRASIPR